jgi:hypothetical protein
MVLGLFYDLWLLFIGIFVYLGAAAEGRFQRAEHALSGVPVEAATITPAWVADVSHLLTPASAGQAFSRQGVLPVTSHGFYVGLIGEREMAVARRGGAATAGSIADRSAPAVRVWEHLDTVLEAIRRSERPALPVLGPDRTVIGIVRADDIVAVLQGRPGPSALAPAPPRSRAA